MARWQHELKQLLILMGPILITQLAQAGYGFVDTIMAGQVSPLDLAAVAIGSGLWLPVFLLISGTVMATTPLVAAAYGAGRHPEVAHIVHQSLWVGLICGLIGMILLRLTPMAFDLLAVPAHLQAPTRLYLQGIAWGMPPVAIFCALRYYSEALGQTRPVMIISVLGVLLNIPVNHVFIHGKFGLPAMGGAGCGWATAVVMFALMLVLLSWVMYAKPYERFRILQERPRPEWPRIRHIFALGLPIGIAIFFEVSVFSLVALLVSPLGEQVVAAHQVSMSVTSLLFMVPLSLAISMTIRTGQAFGRHDWPAIRQVRQTGLMLATGMACLSAMLIVSFRDDITVVYSTDPAVRQLAAGLLLYAAAYQVFDALQVGAAGCLRGIQDTRSPMVLTLIAYWVIAMPVGYSLGMTRLWTDAPLGAHGFWTGLVVGLGTACLLLNWQLAKRLRQLEKRWS
ncbi:MATE family multidrug resistance protein [Fluviicoccus keumensis]|uniref:Multidrug-efflux transporter n=1 Tax=Fluviicoccus keumensis TaxID=1435465 RepID=A0A4Q7Z8K0_9GAMM|nr:MATE family efflux transporter [Fluviicoccus keumensis]RZU46788.1 MATE family multidrug resistance protein [Fluviicoccus keumensis]